MWETELTWKTLLSSKHLEISDKWRPTRKESYNGVSEPYIDLRGLF